MKKDKYALYQAAVQDPDQDIQIYANIYKAVKRDAAKILREDFCGTFAFSCAWVRADKNNVSLALDLDPEPLAYGRKHHLPRLSADERERLNVMQENVMTTTSPKADLVVANNFSFFIFKERSDLVRYCKSVHKSLSAKGIMAVELAGGPEMMKKDRERRTVVLENGQKYVYHWEQKSFNPTTHNGLWAIHFSFPDGSKIKDAFTYDWRLWTIPEVRDCMREAGFARTHVVWEKQILGEPSGQYVKGDDMPNDTFWIAYVVGER